MKILEQKDYQEIRTWIHRNARPLELALWNYCYEKGSKEAVADALGYYQNEDGGFGNGVEPDCWNKESSPYATMIAMELLRRISFVETVGIDHPMIQGIFCYLESGVHSDEEGWIFSIPSNDAYPRAPWWTYNEAENKTQSMGITAGLCAFILRYGDCESKVFKKAFAYAGKIMQKASSAEEFGEMGAVGICMLLDDIKQRDLTSSFACEGLMEKMTAIVNRSIERNPEQWTLYTPRPSEFIRSPKSPFYKDNEDIVKTELDYLIDTRNPDGVWNITWSWFDLGEEYPKEFAVSENWWMASKAIDKVEFLKNFGRLSDGGQ